MSTEILEPLSTEEDDDFSDVAGTDTTKKVRASASTSTTRGGSSPVRRGRGIGDKRLNTIQEKLSSEMFQAGAMIGLGFHTTGYYISQESHDFTKAIVQLASRKKEWVEALEHLADIGPGITAGRTLLGIGAAFAVDRGRVEPDKRFLQFLGVTQAYYEAHNMKAPDNNGYAYKPAPGKFQPVG